MFGFRIPDSLTWGDTVTISFGALRCFINLLIYLIYSYLFIQIVVQISWCRKWKKQDLFLWCAFLLKQTVCLFCRKSVR